MRLWSLHPDYLDAKGLVALWREGLLAKRVLEGGTMGYKNHPQLLRFKQATDPIATINTYLQTIVVTAEQRGYTFDRSKILWNVSAPTLTVTDGQCAFETEHLLTKLRSRDPSRAASLSEQHSPRLHPLFKLTEGDSEAWEIR